MNIRWKNLDTTQQIKWVLLVLAVISAIEVINLLSGRSLNQFGNIPRYVPGLKGIIFGPFLHGSLQHFFANIIPLGIFTYLTLQYGAKRYWLVTVWIILLSGLLVWLFGRSASHIGASGLILYRGNPIYLGLLLAS